MPPIWIAVASLAVTLLTQTAVAFFIAGKLFERVRGLVDRLAKVESGSEANDRAEATAQSSLALAVARIEVNMTHMAADMSDLKSRLKIA